MGALYGSSFRSVCGALIMASGVNSLDGGEEETGEEKRREEEGRYARGCRVVESKWWGGGVGGGVGEVK